MGPNGVYYVFHEAKCDEVRDVKVKTFYIDLVPTQQLVDAVGKRCSNLMVRDHITYGNYEDGPSTFYAICTQNKP